MPRSELVVSDMDAAREELRRGSYGGYSNAEELIRGHTASISPEVRVAQRLRENVEARKAAAEADAEETIQVPDGCTLLSWTVRGHDPRRMVISFVYADKDGEYQKGVQPFDSEKYVVVEEPEEEKDVRARALAARRVVVQSSPDTDKRIDRLEKLVEKLVEGLSPEEPETEPETEEPEAVAEPETVEQAAPAEQTETVEQAETVEQTAPAETEEPQWPRTHEELDALADANGLAFTAEEKKVDQKIAALQSAGVKPS